MLCELQFPVEDLQYLTDLSDDKEHEADSLLASTKTFVLGQDDEEADLDEQAGEDDCVGERDEHPGDCAHDGGGGRGQHHATQARDGQTWKVQTFLNFLYIYVFHILSLCLCCKQKYFQSSNHT